MLYDPRVFTNVRTFEEGKNVILTSEQLTSNERWERETPHICNLIDQNVKLTADSVVLDYGCGVGRIAKELIRRHGCYVIGADISLNMLALSASYVRSERIALCHPRGLCILGIKVDVVLAIWVLQHVEKLLAELDRINDMLKVDGKLFVVNERLERLVPTTKGWQGDDKDVRVELDAKFDLRSDGHLDPNVVGDGQSKRTFWAVYYKQRSLPCQ